MRDSSSGSEPLIRASERPACTLVVLLVAVMLAAALASGCAKKTEVAPQSKATALGNLPWAQHELSASVPDAKLLVVSTDQPTSPKMAPTWLFTFGSPKTGSLYVVYVRGGRPIGVHVVDSSGLTAKEWSAVPGTDAWKIDSDSAYKAALAAVGATTTPGAYAMGMNTYKTSIDTSTAEPFSWRVHLYPGQGGGATQTVDVNATTGAASISK